MLLPPSTGKTIYPSVGLVADGISMRYSECVADNEVDSRAEFVILGMAVFLTGKLAEI